MLAFRYAVSWSAYNPFQKQRRSSGFQHPTSIIQTAVAFLMKMFSSLVLVRRNARPRQRLRKQLNDASRYRSNLSLSEFPCSRWQNKDTDRQTDTERQTKTQKKNRRKSKGEVKEKIEYLINGRHWMRRKEREEHKERKGARWCEFYKRQKRQG